MGIRYRVGSSPTGERQIHSPSSSVGQSSRLKQIRYIMDIRHIDFSAIPVDFSPRNMKSVGFSTASEIMLRRNPIRVFLKDDLDFLTIKKSVRRNLVKKLQVNSRCCKSV